MLKQEQEDLLKEQRKLEQAVSFLLLCLFLSEHTVFTSEVTVIWYCYLAVYLSLKMLYSSVGQTNVLNS